MVRDDEIKRLIQYAKGLHADVTISSRRRDNRTDAVWELFADNSVRITIFQDKNASKLSTVLSLIHEIGHQKDFICSGRRLTGLETPKGILDYEIRGTRYWRSIYQDTNCKFPIWKLYAAMELDLWIYEQDALARRPTRIDYRRVRKEINRSHRLGL